MLPTLTGTGGRPSATSRCRCSTTSALFVTVTLLAAFQVQVYVMTREAGNTTPPYGSLLFRQGFQYFHGLRPAISSCLFRRDLRLP